MWWFEEYESNFSKNDVAYEKLTSRELKQVDQEIQNSCALKKILSISHQIWRLRH